MNLHPYFICLFLLFLSRPSSASIFYVDPINGDMSNNGSENSPWSTLEEVMDGNLIHTHSYSPLPYNPETSILVPKHSSAPVKAGDTLYLRTGFHGDAFMRGAYNSDFISILAEPGQEPVIRSFHIKAGKKWRIEGLTFDTYIDGTYQPTNMVHIESHSYHGPSRDAEVSHCHFTNGPAAEEWSVEEWNSRISSAIIFRGPNMHALNNYILNVDEGINMSADSCSAIGNSVINFGGDGMRMQGSDILLERNVIKNCYNISDNHDDAIQSFTNPANPFYRNIIKNNTIINHENLDHPLKGTLQGIGCFDGPYIDWVIENNLVIVDHYHGISLYGAYNCKILNNTVIDPLPDLGPGPVWIRVNPHKDGTVSENCEIVNNLTSGLAINGSQTVRSNIIANTYEEYEGHFLDYSNNDFRLRSTSTALDSGDLAFAPSLDIEYKTRSLGLSPDVGAYEAKEYECGVYSENKIFVASDASAGGSGVSWSMAVKDLSDALVIAKDCAELDSIFVKAGSYLPTLSENRNHAVEAPAGKMLFGGFSGSESTLELRNLVLPSVLDGNIGQPNLSRDNVHHVVKIRNNSASSSLLDGFTIKGGYSGLIGGSAVLVESGTLILRNCVIENNAGPSDEIDILVTGSHGVLQIENVRSERIENLLPSQKQKVVPDSKVG